MAFDMPQEEANQFIAIGISVGVYTIAEIMSNEDHQFTDKHWAKLMQAMAMEIEEGTGMPAEDFSLLIADRMTEIRAEMKDITQ